MGEFEPVNVIWHNGAKYTCRTAEQLASFLEDGWEIEKPKRKPRKKAEPKEAE